MNAKQERIKRSYPLFMRNDNCFFERFLLISERINLELASRNRRKGNDRFEIMC